MAAAEEKGSHMQPEVSVIIPAYNAASTIARAMDSLRAQHFSAWEAVVVDDGSTDNTPHLIAHASRADPRIRLIRQRNGGVSRARNAGLDVASAALVAFLDADDELAPTHLSTLLGAHRASGADVTYCGYQEVSPSGRRSEAIFSAETAHRPYRALSRYCTVVVHGLIVRGASIKDVGSFDPLLANSEDWDLWIRLARAGARFYGLAEPLAAYRLTAGSLSNQHLAAFRNGLTVLRRARRRDFRLDGAGSHLGEDLPIALESAILFHVHWYAVRAALRGEPITDYIGELLPCSVNCEIMETLARNSFYGLFAQSDYRYEAVGPLWRRSRHTITELFRSMCEQVPIGPPETMMRLIDAIVIAGTAQPRESTLPDEDESHIPVTE